MDANEAVALLKRAQHKSGGVYPYLWNRRELPPIRSGVTAEFIRFCSWMSELSVDPGSRPRNAVRFLKSSMLDNGSVPYEMTPPRMRPVQECPYLVADAMSVAIAGQVFGDEDMVGRSLDFITWSYRQLPSGKFLPMWYNFEQPQSRMPDEWVHQPTCHQSLIAQIELDGFVCDTWGETITDDIAAVFTTAMTSRSAGLFDADKYRQDVPLQAHFMTCDSMMKYYSASGDTDAIRPAVDGVRQAVDLLSGCDGAGDTAVPNGGITGAKRSRLIATAVRSGLLANTVLSEEIVSCSELSRLLDILLDYRFTDGFGAGMFPVSNKDGEDSLICVGGCMVAAQAKYMFGLEHPEIGDFRILV